MTHSKSEVVHTNKKHPFLTVEHGFLPVASVTVGMHVERADGSIGIVTKWQIVPGISMMYNLEVAQDHTFTVGTGQWIVHNCNVGDPVHVSLPKNRYPQTAAHIADATANGQPRVLTVARTLADDNRANSLADHAMVKGYDRDEYPMAFTKEGGAGADVRYIDPSDNRGAGSFIAKQLAGHPDGTTFIIDIVDEWLF